MRNVLSVIGEYAGLLDDLLARVKIKGGRGQEPEKLKKLAASIDRQVKKGTEIMQRLSSFSHATDEETASFDLTALTENVSALARRRATLAGCRLEMDLPDEAIRLSGNPFTTQRAIFIGIELVVELLEAGDTVALNLTGAAASGAEQLSARIPELSAVVIELSGEVETSTTDGALSLIVTIPVS
jgi:hypothetical protein